MKIERPASVRVLGKNFTVQFCKQGPMDLEDFGHMLLGKQQIAIQDNLPSELERDTLLHEVIHAISDQTDMGLTEHQVQILGCALMQVFLDNAEFTAYLTKK